MARCDNCCGVPDDMEIHQLCDDCVRTDLAEEARRLAEKDAEIARLRAENAAMARDARVGRAVLEVVGSDMVAADGLETMAFNIAERERVLRLDDLAHERFLPVLLSTIAAALRSEADHGDV